MADLVELELLEREGELAMAGRLAENAAGSSGALALVEGPAGVGKSSLLRKAVGLARERGFDTASARASELERDFAFGLVRQLFEPKLARLGCADREEALAGAAGLAAPLFEQLDADSLTPRGEASHATLHGLYWLTVNLATKQPLALSVDDLHWGDPPSLRFLAYLANRVEELPVLMVAGARPDEPGAEVDLLEQLAAAPSTHLIRPHPLGRESVAALVGSVLGDPAPEFAAACYEATQGNPMLLKELVSTLHAEGVEPAADRAGVVLEMASRSVARSVALRLRRLGPTAERLAHAVSVLGDGTALETAARLAELEPAQAAPAVAALDKANILRSEAIEFVHPVVRAAIYSRLEPAERAERHRSAAALLAGVGADEDEVALHLIPGRPAGDDWVVDALRRAARRAHSRGAPDIAAKYLLRALTEPPAVEQRPDILVDLGLAELAVNESGGLARLREALPLPTDPVARGRLALQYGRSLFMWVDYAGAARVFEDALAELPDDESELREQLEAHLVSTCFVDPALRPRVAERLWALLEDSSKVTDPVMLGTLAVTAVLMVPRSAGLELAERALEDGRLSVEEHPTVVAMAAVALMAGGRLRQAERVWDRAIAEALSHGALYAAGFALTLRAHTRMRIGSIAAAEADAGAALRDLPEGAPAQIRWILAPLLDALVERGELEGAARLLHEHEDAWPLPDAPESLFLLVSTAHLRAAQRRFGESIEDLRECGRRLDSWGVRNPGYVPWRAELAAVLAASGARDEARELAVEAAELAREFEVPRELGMALRAGGMAAGGKAGVALLREAVDVLAGSEAELEHARALVELGAGCDVRVSARQLGTRSAAAWTRPSGWARPCLPLARTRSWSRRGRGRGSCVLSGVDSLTASERRVAEMASEGLSNREIAQALFRDREDRREPPRARYRKLDIKSRSGLPAALVRRPGTPVP